MHYIFSLEFLEDYLYILFLNIYFLICVPGITKQVEHWQAWQSSTGVTDRINEDSVRLLSKHGPDKETNK